MAQCHTRQHGYSVTDTNDLQCVRDVVDGKCPGLLLPAVLATDAVTTQHHVSLDALVESTTMFDDNAQHHAKRVTDLFLSLIGQLITLGEVKCYINNITITNLFLVGDKLQVSDFGLSHGIECFKDKLRNQWLGILLSFVQFLFLTKDCKGVLDHHARQWDQREAFRCYIYPLFINVILSPTEMLGSQIIGNFEAFRGSQDS